jgi:hypothetical protein
MAVIGGTGFDILRLLPRVKHLVLEMKCKPRLPQKEENQMKRSIMLIIVALALAGCSQSIARSEFLQHDSMYKNWDHMKFSMFGYRNPTAEDVKEATEQGWWGIDVPYVPGQ